MYLPRYTVDENLKRQALDTVPHAPGNVCRGSGLNTAAARSRCAGSKTSGRFSNGR